jgi:hypothetical protein
MSNSSIACMRALVGASLMAVVVTTGCGSFFVSTHLNNNLDVRTDVAKHTLMGDMFSPFPQIRVTGQFNSDISSPSTTPFGSKSAWDVTTVQTSLGAIVTASNVYMPAKWDVYQYFPPNFCASQASLTLSYLSVPVHDTPTFTPGPDSAHDAQYTAACYINPPGSFGIVSGPVNPQVVLDTAFPSTITVNPDYAPNTSAAATHLRVFDTSLNSISTVTATYIDSSGATSYPFPTTSTGANLPPGAYAVVTTGDPSGLPQQTFGLDAFFVAHNDTSYTGAFGVAAIPSGTQSSWSNYIADPYGDGTCVGSATYWSEDDASPAFALVTLVTQGKLAVGSSSTLVTVGTSPTVVIPFNQGGFDYEHDGPCNSWGSSSDAYQSALVVNTGSNSITIVPIGTYYYPSGTVSVGTSPVAAAIYAGKAYVANYGGGTISEVDLTSLTVTRTLTVMSHPTSVTFDTSNNLWVGGQGAIDKISLSGWSISSTTSVDGTVQNMAYSPQSGALVQTLLQNGSPTALSRGATMAAAVSYSSSSGQSYSAPNVFNVSSLTSSTGSFGGDNSSYNASSAVSYLAFPGQIAGAPPVISAASGDITASVTGTSFKIMRISDGAVAVSGTLPYPVRSVAMDSGHVYFTMPESSSLVTMPIIMP